MTAQPITLNTARGTVTGLVAGSSQWLPLIVCIPGGSYNAHYFNVPGHSLLAEAQSQGFPVAALDRPGYGGSDPLVGNVTFAGNATVLDAAIDELWTTYGVSSPGVVLVGHSIGGAVGVHLAAQPHTWPLLGISITSIHTDAPEQVSDAWNSIPAEAHIPFSREQRLQFMYGPAGTYEPAVIDSAERATDPIPVAELREVVGRWTTDFGRLAARVKVPVHYALAEHEQLWHSTTDSVAGFAQAFTSSPEVSAERVAGSGHNLDHHHESIALHHRQLAFARSVSSP